MSQPGEILIDQATYGIVAGQVVTRPLESVQVKGHTQPVVIYELVGLK